MEQENKPRSPYDMTAGWPPIQSVVIGLGVALVLIAWSEWAWLSQVLYDLLEWVVWAV